MSKPRQFVWTGPLGQVHVSGSVVYQPALPPEEGTYTASGTITGPLGNSKDFEVSWNSNP